MPVPERETRLELKWPTLSGGSGFEFQIGRPAEQEAPDVSPARDNGLGALSRGLEKP